jgi:hypothetical protein
MDGWSYTDIIIINIIIIICTLEPRRRDYIKVNNYRWQSGDINGSSNNYSITARSYGDKSGHGQTVFIVSRNLDSLYCFGYLHGMQVTEETQHWSRTMTIIEVINNFASVKKNQRENGYVLLLVFQFDRCRNLTTTTSFNLSGLHFNSGFCIVP